MTVAELKQKIDELFAHRNGEYGDEAVLIDVGDEGYDVGNIRIALGNLVIELEWGDSNEPN